MPRLNLYHTIFHFAYIIQKEIISRSLKYQAKGVEDPDNLFPKQQTLHLLHCHLNFIFDTKSSILSIHAIFVTPPIKSIYLPEIVRCGKNRKKSDRNRIKS